MRKYIALFLALVCVLGLVGCSTDNSGALKTTEESTHTISADLDVIFTVDEHTTEQATCTIENMSEQEIVYDYSYGIEVKQNGKWYAIEHDEMIVQTVQLSLNPGEKETFVCNWKDGYGALPKGTYRIIKNASISEFEFVWLSAEFSVE